MLVLYVLYIIGTEEIQEAAAISVVSAAARQESKRQVVAI
jgi:hypothetical protein